MHPTYLPSAQCPVPSLPPMAEMETSNFLQLQQLPTSLLAGSTVVGLLHLSLWQIQITDLNRPQVGKEKKKKIQSHSHFHSSKHTTCKTYKVHKIVVVCCQSTLPLQKSRYLVLQVPTLRLR